MAENIIDTDQLASDELQNFEKISYAPILLSR